MISAFRKTSVFFLLIAIFLSYLHFGQQKDQIISLPVVIHGSNSGSPGALVLEDFELFVNGEKRDVISFRKKDRNLGRNSDLARDFILSFGFSELDEHLKRALSYFLTEVLKPSDTLSVVTPGNLDHKVSYRLKRVMKVDDDKRCCLILRNEMGRILHSFNCAQAMNNCDE